MSTVQIVAHQIPSVIDNALLERKAAEAKASIQDIEILDLHSHSKLQKIVVFFNSITLPLNIFVEIAMIENLWRLEKLTVLKLNDNCIEEIENFNSLVNLRELNLSYNRICKIENLDKLVLIEKLLLHSNRIKVLENLDNLQNLQLLSVSNNEIESVKNVLLARLKKLYNNLYFCKFIFRSFT